MIFEKKHEVEKLDVSSQEHSWNVFFTYANFLPNQVRKSLLEILASIKNLIQNQTSFNNFVFKVGF